MTTTPAPITSATVRRHLEGAGPTVAETLKALAAGSSVEPPPSLPIVERVETIKRRALAAGAHEAAWLLYMGARSLLFSIEEAARDMDWLGSPAVAVPELRAQYDHLAQRLRSTGRPLPAWAIPNPESMATAVADECLNLAEAIRPEWPWLQLERGLVAMGRHDWQRGIQLAQESRSLSRERSLTIAATRNAIDCALRVGAIKQHQQLVVDLEVLLPGSRLVSGFQLCLQAGTGDAESFTRTAQEFLEATDDHGREYWLHFLAFHGPAWVRSLGGTARDTLTDLEGRLT